MSAAADAPPRPPSSRAPRSSAAPAAPKRQPGAKAKPGHVRRLVRPALALVTLVLIADALVGENGWFERHREQDRLTRTTSELVRIKQENAELADRARRLEAADPAVIEDLARRKLEMLKPGEVLFIDGTPPASATASSGSR